MQWVKNDVGEIFIVSLKALSAVFWGMGIPVVFSGVLQG